MGRTIEHMISVLRATDKTVHDGLDMQLCRLRERLTTHSPESPIRSGFPLQISIPSIGVHGRLRPASPVLPNLEIQPGYPNECLRLRMCKNRTRQSTQQDGGRVPATFRGHCYPHLELSFLPQIGRQLPVLRQGYFVLCMLSKRPHQHT